MNRPVGSVSRDDKDTWTLRKIGVVLDLFGLGHTSNHVSGKQTVRREFVVPVVGNTHLTLGGL